MNAHELTDLLLEINVINVKDIDAELKQLAARLIDPRAESWFMRVPRYFLINIDRLLKEPYVAKAEPRVEPTPTEAGGSKYYADPKGGWLAGPGRAPEMAPPGGLGPETDPYAGQPDVCKKCNGTGLVKIVNHAETGRPVEVAVPYQEAEHATPEQRAAFKRCRTCRGTGKRAKASLQKIYRGLPPEHQAAYLGKISPEMRQRMAVEAWVDHFLNRFTEAYDPEKRTYTTSLHKPGVQRDIEQSFTPFKPAKAKTKRIHGAPPTKKELQPWMTAPGAEEKEFYHFDPIQIRRRELFGRLATLVNFLNYQTVISRKGDDPKKAALAREANGMLERLRGYKTDDIEGFRDVMKAAYDFGTKVKEDPGHFTNDGQVIAALNDLELRKTIFPETVVALASRGGEDPPSWDIKTIAKAEHNLQKGPIYFVDKNEAPYVVVWFDRTDACFDVNNAIITPEIAREIAPLFADRQRFPPDDIINARPLARQVEIPEQSREVMQLPGGYRLMQLLAPFDLAREGAVTQHCVGNNTYQNRLAAGTHSYYSLRDPENKSMVTVEVEQPNRVQQMKGFANSTSLPAPIPGLLRQIIREQGWTVHGDTQSTQDRAAR